MSYKEDIVNYLTYGEYDKVIEVYEKIGIEKIKKILYEIAYYDKEISTYDFAFRMSKYDEKHKKEWIEIAQLIMKDAFSWIKGATSIAFFHAKQLLKEEYSVKNLLALTDFNGMPDFLLSDEECIKIAKEILILDPNNSRAKEILEKFNIK